MANKWDNYNFAPGTIVSSNFLNDVVNKNQEFVSVKDFGAVGDGVTDDTVAIQAAIATRKNISFPEGNYNLSDTLSLTTPGQRIVGYGATVTQTANGKHVFTGSLVSGVTIRGFNVVPSPAKTSNVDPGRTEVLLFASSDRLSIEDNEINWSGSTQAHSGIKLTNCNDCIVRGNVFRNAPSTSGVYFVEGGADIEVLENSSRNLITENRCVSGQVYGVNITTSSTGECVNNIVTDNIVSDSTAYGIVLYRGNASATFRDHVVSNNTIENITGATLSDGPAPSAVRKFGAGIYVQGAYDCTITGNSIRNVAQQTNDDTLAQGGISGTVTSAVVTGNHIDTSGRRGIFFSGLAAAASPPDPANSALVIDGNVIKSAAKESIYVNLSRKLSVQGNIVYRGATVDGSTSIRITSNGDWQADASVIGNVIHGDDGAARGQGVVIEQCRVANVIGNSMTEVTTGIGADTTVSFNCVGNYVKDATGFGVTFTSAVTSGNVGQNTLDTIATAGIRWNGSARDGGNSIINTTTQHSGTYAPIRTLANAATVDFANAKLVYTGGTTAITDITGGDIGDEVTILAGHSVTITHNAAKISLSGAGNFSMVSGNTLTLKKGTATVWHEVGRKV